MKSPIAKVYVVPSMEYPSPEIASYYEHESWNTAMRISATTITVLLMLGMDIEQELKEDARVPRGSFGRPCFFYFGSEDKNPESVEAIEIFKRAQIAKRDFVLRKAKNRYGLESACYKPQERRNEIKERFKKK